jgi:hypothetical protein
MRRLWLAGTLAFLIGCGGSGGGEMPGTPAPGTPSSAPTWYQDVAPIVARSCTGCHKPGGIAPFALTQYEAARGFAQLMSMRVHDETMPPWGAIDTPECKPRLPWKQDLRLSAAEKSIIKRWADAGAPAGDAKKAAPVPDPPSIDLSNTTKRLTMAAPFVTQGNRDQFRCFPLPYKFEQDVWMTGLQVVPGNSRVVHHVVVYLDEQDKSSALVGPDGSFECFGGPGVTPASLLGAWAPGVTPLETPDGVGIPIKKGSRVVLNVHYHPAGRTETDASSLDLRWTTTKTPWQGLMALIGNFKDRDAKTGDGLLPGPNDPPAGPAFVIPAGAKNHTEDQRFTLPNSLLLGGRLFGTGAHMHYVGTDMRIEIDRSGRLGGNLQGDPVSECLLETPRWDFSWQRGYGYDAALDKLPSLRAGDVLRMRCTYNNTMDNPHVRQALAEQGLSAPRDVRLGEQTLDEMCLGAFGIAYQAP